MLHCPEQHWLGSEQSSPLAVQEGAPHSPALQIPEQHWPGALGQLRPLAVQVEGPHLFWLLQYPEQHWLGLEQVRPSSKQVWGPHLLWLLHWPEQHWVSGWPGLKQAVFSERQHFPPVQLLLPQQSEGTEQPEEPSGTQITV